MKLLDCVKKLPLPQRHAVMTRVAWGDEVDKKCVLLDERDFDNQLEPSRYVLCRPAKLSQEDLDATDWYVASPEQPGEPVQPVCLLRQISTDEKAENADDRCNNELPPSAARISPVPTFFKSALFFLLAFGSGLLLGLLLKVL